MSTLHPNLQHNLNSSLSAIAVAYHKGKIYHRDLSLGNVMMTENRSDSEGPWGVLNDWDHALWIDAAPTDRIVSISSRFNQPTAADTL